MYSFPQLEPLLRKNGSWRLYFAKSLNWLQNQSVENVSSKVANDSSNLDHKQYLINYKTNQTADPSAIPKNSSSIGFPKDIHWKKRIQIKFETEPRSKTDGNQRKNYEANIWEIGSCFRLSHGSSTECRLCDKKFGNHRLLTQHKTFAHFSERSDKPFCYIPYFAEPNKFHTAKTKSYQLTCSLCKTWLSGIEGSVQTYLDGLKNDKRKSDGESKKRVKKSKSMSRRVCELCSKILSNRKGLERHMLIHTGEKPFPCDICGKPFRRKDNCVRHKKTAHLFKKPRKPRRRRNNNNNDLNVETINIVPEINPLNSSFH